VLAGAVVAALSLALYVPTLLPDVGTWDTAEFQAIGPLLGIAHPTGYPTYTLLAWLASVVLQPFGNEAYRADLLSALLMAGAAGLLAIRAVQATRRWPLGIVAGTAFAVAPVAWRLSTRADAHALHVFLAALILVLLAEWQQRSGGDRGGGSRWLLAAAVVYGLSLGNHALTLLLAPGIAAYVLVVAPRILWRQWRLVLGCLAATTLVAALVYAYLPLRSAMDPPLDYGDPETWGAFWYVVLGQQFQGSFGALPSLPDLVAGVWDELVRNLGPLATLVPAGAVLGTLRHPRLVVATGLWLACTWLFALGYPNAAIERYYLVPLLVAALWVALAADVAWDALVALVRTPLGPRGAAPLVPETAVAAAAVRAPQALGSAANSPGRWWPGRLLPGLLVAALLAISLAAVPGRHEAMDASDETFGREWLEATLRALPPDAAVISWWSYSTPLWYGRWVEGRREDLVIVDDRDVLDSGLGTVEGAIEHFLGRRPVYVIRLERDLAALAERYILERVPEVPGPGHLYRVVGRRLAGRASVRPAGAARRPGGRAAVRPEG
jgi:4-amino-4-deoxy-L-arabinose transferase-like glycosyltransferase